MIRPCRVCHISTVHAPFDQRIFHRACWSLAHAGYDVHLLVQLDEPERIVDGVHVHSIGPMAKQKLGMRAGTRLRRFVAAERLARRLQADVYHFHDPELIPLGLWLRLVTRARVVFDCHENNTGYIQQKHWLHPWMRRLLVLGMSGLEFAAARCLDAVVAADEGVAQIFRQRYRARSVVTLHNFPRLDLFPARAATAPRALATVVAARGSASGVGTVSGGHGTLATRVAAPAAREDKEFDLVYHGTIPRYHLEVAFAVAESLRRRGVRARWLFFGKCPEAKWAQAEIERRGLQSDFTLDPVPVPHDDVARRVRQARIGFIPLPDLPKFQHNIPTKLFEFMQLGMPTVMSDLPPSRPFVGDGACAVLVPPDDYEAYAAAIEALLRDPARADHMGREGERRTRERYNWELESKKLLQLYAEWTGAR